MTVLLEHFDLTQLIMQLSSPGTSSKMGLWANCLKFPPTSLLAPLLASKFELWYSYFTVSATSLHHASMTSTSKWSGQNRTSRSSSYALEYSQNRSNSTDQKVMFLYICTYVIPNIAAMLLFLTTVNSIMTADLLTCILTY